MDKKELCQRCGGNYKTPQLLRIHFQVSHNEDFVKCKECNEEFQGKKKLYNHMRSHQKNPCNFCWKLFPKNSLVFHLSVCPARSEIPKFNCEFCPFESARKQKLKSHVSSVHQAKEIKENKEFKQKKLLPQHSAENLRNYECTVCYKTFPRKFSLTRHMNTEHLQKKLNMRTGFGIFEEETVSYSQFECNICDYKTSRSNNLKNHKINKHEN